MRLFVEKLEMTEYIKATDTPLDIDSKATKNGWTFSMDDMGDCYISEDPECSEFVEVEF